MQRPYHLAVAVLAALTAVALLGAAVAIRPPGLPAEPDGPHEAANRALAHAFYAAANTAIETGDLVPLATVVAPDLLAEEATEDGRAGPVGLRRRLLAIHAAMPTLRLTVTELAVDGDLVIARVDAGATRMESFLGLPLVEAAPAWGPVDVLRLADGRVVELTSSTDGTVLLESALAVPQDLPTDDPRVLAVERITIAAEATHGAAAVAGFRLLYLEAGALTVEVVATSFYAARPVRLAAGEHLAIPARVAYTARNVGGAPAVLLDLTTRRRPDPAEAQLGYGEPPAPSGRSSEVGVVDSVLAHSEPGELPTGPLVLAVGRVTLAPGARLAWAAAPGSVLFHVEAGTAHLDPGAGLAWAQDATGQPVPLNGAPLAAGDGAVVVVGSAAIVGNGADVPVTLLIVTLLPEDGPAPTASPHPLTGL